MHLPIDGLQTLLFLEELRICYCPNLEDVPNLDNLTSLLELHIYSKWASLLHISYQFVNRLMPQLVIMFADWPEGWPKLKSLPQQIQHFTSLTSLSIISFNQVETLPEWLGNLTSLTFLGIQRCENLMHLHLVKAMQRLDKLQELVVDGCTRLEERCAKKVGLEWPKISHVPNVTVY
ncbi:hypothetical protein PRUPE_2G067400 [Prunus persica]|uniref:Uncharacterized protein n=1 Tax=Prunus persica TaxID=3760 RepID=A0A251QCG0_PRUPE|nr:hypothetical protein PRUPE_2G067400 [Prunus persica]